MSREKGRDSEKYARMIGARALDACHHSLRRQTGQTTAFTLSRDGGQTFTPVAKDGRVDLTSQPPGSQLVARVELSGPQYLDALAYGATNV